MREKKQADGAEEQAGDHKAKRRLVKNIPLLIAEICMLVALDKIHRIPDSTYPDQPDALDMLHLAPVYLRQDAGGKAQLGRFRHPLFRHGASRTVSVPPMRSGSSR